MLTVVDGRLAYKCAFIGKAIGFIANTFEGFQVVSPIFVVNGFRLAFRNADIF